MKCGRHPGGDKVDKLGLCPAATDSIYDVSTRGTPVAEPAGLFPEPFAMGKSRVRLPTNRIRVKIVPSIRKSTRKKVLQS